MNTGRRIVDILRSDEYKQLKPGTKTWLRGYIEGVIANANQNAKPKEPREKRD